MHELSVTESVLDIACKHAEQAQAKQVTDIYLVIGNLSSIAELVCLDCDTHYILDDELTPCPNCRSARIRVVSGDEFNLESIEIRK
jgi:hydrogenase nickel incorporation protein HypA/HybF